MRRRSTLSEDECASNGEAYAEEDAEDAPLIRESAQPHASHTPHVPKYDSDNMQNRLGSLSDLMLSAGMESAQFPNDEDEARVPIGAPVAPLPTPPTNYAWHRNEDGTYQLNSCSGDKEEAVLIEHVVMPSDTLQGVCLRYRAGMLDVRRINYLSANSIHHLRVLRVPLKPDIPVNIQLKTHEVVVQDFCARTGESLIEARYYLEDCHFDMETALRLWRGDEEWATQAKGAASAHRVRSATVQIVTEVTAELPRDTLRRRVKGA